MSTSDTMRQAYQTLALLCWKKADQLLNLSTQMMQAAEALQEESESYAKQAQEFEAQGGEETEGEQKAKAQSSQGQHEQPYPILN